MTTKLKWRLGKLPTPEEVLKLVNDKLITKEEAREMLFSEENEKEPTTEDMKSEIKFLRELIDRLSDKTKIVETIRYIEKPYYEQRWYQPYYYWSGNGGCITNGSTLKIGGTITAGSSSLSNQGYLTYQSTGQIPTPNLATNVSFKEIQTF